MLFFDLIFPEDSKPDSSSCGMLVTETAIESQPLSMYKNTQSFTLFRVQSHSKRVCDMIKTHSGMLVLDLLKMVIADFSVLL